MTDSSADEVYQRPHVRRAVLAFMSQLGNGTHKALNTSNNSNCRYNKEKNLWEPAEVEGLYDEANKARERFLSVVEQYDQTAEPKYKTNVDIRSEHGWEDVMKAVDDGVEAYQTQALTGFWGRIRRGFRKFSNAGSSCCAFLDLIPDSVFSSAICGTLKLILSAAQRIGEVRQEVMDALESLPEILSNTEETLSIYYTSEQMHRKTASLYVSIIDALEAILTWFKRRAAGKAFRALFQQGDYKQTLINSMEAMKVGVALFNETAMRCAMHVLRNVDQGVARSRQENNAGFNKINLDNNAVLSQLTDIRVQVEQIARQQVALAAKHANVLNKAQTSFEDQMLDSRAPAPPAPKKPQKPSVDAESILKHLTYDTETLNKDLATCLRIRRNLTLKEEDRVGTIIQHQRLVAWLKSPESDLVLVNSNGENKRWSPMSYVSAQITTSFGTSDGSIIPLYFFCGEHINWRKDRKAYPSSLMSSLIAQLLSHSHTSNLSPTERLTNKLKSGTTIDLCGAFRRLIKQIPDTVIVLCVIDGISYFEDEERREDICTVVRSLNSLVHREKGPLLKVLLGSPSSCRHVLRYVDKASVINIPSICPTQGGFRQMQLHRLTQRAKENVDTDSESK